jgi:hypothetical protein
MLKTIAGEAEKQVNQKLDSVVVSVPAYFDPLRVSPIVDAARMAGFVHVKTIPEPVAAALAYDIEITVKPVRVLVFDLGAGTLDITAGYMFRHSQKVDEVEFHVMKNTGDTRLGGIDMDDRLMGLIMERCRLSGIGLEEQAVLRRSAEMAKIRLSQEDKIEHAFRLNGVEYRCMLAGSDLRSAFQGSGPQKNLLEACRRQVMSALEESGWSPQEVELLLLIGGPTKLPAIQEMLEIVFHSNSRVLEQIDLFYSGKEKVDRMNAVSIGAALSVDRKVDDKAPAGYGLEVIEMDEEQVSYWPNILVPRDSCYPYKSKPYLIPWVHVGGFFEFKIVQHAPKGEAEQAGYEYKFVGIQKFAVKNPSHCMIAVQMGYNANKELEVMIQNILSHESVTYVGMNQSANIGMAYPLVVKKPIHLEAAHTKKRSPAPDTIQKFSEWAQETAGAIKGRITQFPVPQMLIAQILDEVELAIKKGPTALEFESVYTQVNSLIWNANSRGLLTQGQFIALTNRLTEFEDDLFVTASE